MQGLSRHLILGEEHAHYTDNTPRERNRVLTEQEGANPQSHQTSCQYTAQNGPDAERLCQHTTAIVLSPLQQCLHGVCSSAHITQNLTTLFTFQCIFDSMTFCFIGSPEAIMHRCIHVADCTYVRVYNRCINSNEGIPPV